MYVRSGNCAIKSATFRSVATLPAPGVAAVLEDIASLRSVKSPNCAPAAAWKPEASDSAAVDPCGKSSKASSKPEAAADASVHLIAQSHRTAAFKKVIQNIADMAWLGTLRWRRRWHEHLAGMQMAAYYRSEVDLKCRRRQIWYHQTCRRTQLARRPERRRVKAHTNQPAADA